MAEILLSTSEKTGNPLYVQPSVLVLYRADQRFVLDAVIPRRGACDLEYDLVIAAQPYRARHAVDFKVAYEKYVLHKVRAAKAEPYYEKLVLKMVGAVRLKDNA